MAYLLDTNVFIEARNRYYGFDLCVLDSGSDRTVQLTMGASLAWTTSAMS